MREQEVVDTNQRWFGKMVKVKIADADKMRTSKLDSAWVKAVWAGHQVQSGETHSKRQPNEYHVEVQRLPQDTLNGNAEMLGNNCRGPFQHYKKILNPINQRPGGNKRQQKSWRRNSSETRCGPQWTTHRELCCDLSTALWHRHPSRHFPLHR